MNICEIKFKSIICILLLSITPVASSIDIAKDDRSEVVELINTSNNQNMYGSWLFEGGFSNVSFSGVNPDYRISSGDNLLVQLWGGVDFQQKVIVDPKGNIFIPQVGPVRVLGVSNQDLNKVVLKSIKRTYKSNVESYVTLVSTQKVKIFLTGLVNNPGLYEGQSGDSVLRFIDQANGIRSDIGGLRQIQLIRNGKTVEEIDLYRFLSSGDIPRVPLRDGDVIYVGARKGVVTIEGKVGFSGQYELKEESELIAHILSSAIPSNDATGLTVIETLSKNTVASQYAINDLEDKLVHSGALIKVVAQQRVSSISVELIGEHNSDNELIMPWGASLEDVISHISFTKLSNKQGIQLYRKSVATRQKDMLQTSLDSLEQSVLTARSSTSEEASLRKSEADIILKWISKARMVDPKGQVLLSDGYEPNKIILQQGDRVVIPASRNLVMVHGEVLFPTAIAFNEKLTVEGLINKAGGTNRSVSDYNILVMHPNGEFSDANSDLDELNYIKPGDEVFVLAVPDEKSLQLTKDLTQIMYQIAVSSAVILAL